MEDRSIVGASRARSIRLFISSTFRDLQGEREELIKRVFPRIRTLCESRGVNWGEVDLRWGITASEAREGRVLPICLDEIDECRPFFIAILGERYGWAPEAIDPELMERFPWLADAAGRSVTELEIQHGAFRAPSARAFFYFRDPAWVDRLPRAERANFESIDPRERRKLAELKARIRASSYPVRDFADARALGELVAGDLTAMLEEFFPKAPATAVERDEAARLALIDRLAQGHVGRDAELGRLDRFLGAVRSPAALCVVGDAGAGKSSLLAAWIMRHSAPVPGGPEPGRSRWAWLLEILGSSGGRAGHERLWLSHFAAASDESLDTATMLRRLIEALGGGGGFRQEIPNDPIGLSSAFVNALGRAATTRRIVLLLDGLDQLDPRGRGLGLAWLPERLPRGARLVVSTTPGSISEELARRGWPVLRVEPFDAPGRRAFAAAYLWRNHRRRLDPDQLDAVASVEPGANAQFLQTFLEELRASARGIEELPDRIAHYAASRTLEELFDKVLARLEREHDDSRPGLVRETLSLLSVARLGLSDRELLELLGKPGDPLPPAFWAPLHLALRPFLVPRSGLFAPMTPAFRAAIARRYLPRPDDRAAVHRRLADYFGMIPTSVRTVEERPWHLSALGALEELAELCAAPEFLIAAWPVHQYELRSYWAAIESRSPGRMLEAHAGLIRDPNARPEAAWIVARLLADTGHRAEASNLARWRAARAEADEDAAGLLAALDLTAAMARDLEDPEAARRLAARQAEVAERVGDADARVAALMRLVAAHRQLRQPERAAAILAEAERLAVAGGLTDRLADLLGQRANLLSESDPRAALGLYRRQAVLHRQLGDLAGLRVCLGNQGAMLGRLRRSGQALAALSEEEAIARQVRDLAGLESNLGRRVELLIRRGRLDEAVTRLEEREKLCRDVLRDPRLQALAQLQRAELYGVAMKQTRLGLHHIEKARALAAAGRCSDVLAEQIDAMRGRILAAPLRDLE